MLLKRMQKNGFTSSLLACIESGEDGGGGDDGGGGGNDGGGGGGQQGLNEELKKYITGAVNSALTNRLKRGAIKEELGGMVTEAVTNAVGSAMESFKPPEDEKGNKKGSGGDIHQHPDFQAMIARQKELEGKLQKQQEEREQERKQRQAAEERGALERTLRGNGIAEKLVPAATALLYDSRRVLGRNDDGQIVFRAQRDGYVDELKLEDGIREWIDSDEGKSFLPATDSSGSGARGGSSPPRQARKPKGDDGELSEEEAEQVLFGYMSGGG